MTYPSVLFCTHPLAAGKNLNKHSFIPKYCGMSAEGQNCEASKDSHWHVKAMLHATMG
jgi:hypothetical protein